MSQGVERVAIAVVELEGRFLVGRRRPEQALAGLAEFPGGKCLPGEAASACAVRECREETGVDIIALRPLYTCRHAYAHGTLDLEFWLCRPAPSPILLKRPRLAGGGFEWVPVQALKSLHFPEANRPVIDLLAAGTMSVG